jgi:hypothetical protein
VLFARYLGTVFNAGIPAETDLIGDPNNEAAMPLNDFIDQTMAALATDDDEIVEIGQSLEDTGRKMSAPISPSSSVVSGVVGAGLAITVFPVNKPARPCRSARAETRHPGVALGDDRLIVGAAIP